METAPKQFKKRNAILTCLRSTDTHPSAEMVHEMLRADHPDISVATIYRNLAWFKAQGLVQSVATVKGIERFDANTEPHVHFICSSCDAVMDLHQMQMPESLSHSVETSCGCRVDQCQLTFSGTCQACLEKNKSTDLC